MHPGDTWTHQVADGGTYWNNVSANPELVDGVSYGRVPYTGYFGTKVAFFGLVI